MRSSSVAVAVLALVVVALLVAIVLYALPPRLLGGASRGNPCRLVVYDVDVERGVLRAWVRATACTVAIEAAFLERPDGSLSARLWVEPLRVTPRGSTLTLTPSEPIDPGDYLLVLVYRGGRVAIPVRLPRLTPLGCCLCIYYGPASNAGRLTRCTSIVLSPLVDPGVFPAPVKLGYLSITTVGGWEPWASLVTPDIVVGYNPTWNEEIVNACSTKWWRIVDYAAEYILSRGFQGLFLDNLDVVDEYPWMARCVTALVEHLRETHPSALIVVNRGFSIIDGVAPYINAVLVEDFPTYYNATLGEYLAWSGEQLEWYLAVIKHLEALRERYGLGIYLLAYWNTTSPGAAETICSILDRLGLHLPVYIAGYDLQEPGLCPPCSCG